MGEEFRWEFKEIGQGHYSTDLHVCLDDARRASKEKPDLIVIVERFRPLRWTITEMKNGEETARWREIMEL